jgi:hypothetical protein
VSANSTAARETAGTWKVGEVADPDANPVTLKLRGWVVAFQFATMISVALSAAL